MENAVKAAAAGGGGGGGGGGAGEQDLGDGTVQCSEHRFKNISSINSGGICAFCLQEKLGKLVSSSFPPHPIIPSSSSSPSPSFRSDINGVYGGFGNSSVASSSSSAGKRVEAQLSGQRNRNRSRMIPFVSTGGARAKKSPADVAPSFKRSKSTTSAPRRGPLVGAHQVDDSSPRSRRIGFWSSIFYLSSSSRTGDSGKTDRGPGEAKITNPASGEEDDDMSQRKVSRSRSVGCGSRSFSGDFFERISSGFGDCTLRRVESQREGHGKPSRSHGRRQRAAAQKQDSIKERVKCGGIFSGFMLTTSSSSSSSSSSSYWVCDEIGRGGAAGNGNCGRPGGGGHGRNRGSSGWAWAFASPMRAFSRPSSKAGDKIRGEAAHKSKKNNTASTAPDLNSIPSLLSVSG